jgi:hypothetical protein
MSEEQVTLMRIYKSHGWGKDVHDVVGGIAQQSRCDGNVGMIGILLPTWVMED